MSVRVFEDAGPLQRGAPRQPADPRWAVRASPRPLTPPRPPAADQAPRSKRTQNRFAARPPRDPAGPLIGPHNAPLRRSNAFGDLSNASTPAAAAPGHSVRVPGKQALRERSNAPSGHKEGASCGAAPIRVAVRKAPALAESPPPAEYAPAALPAERDPCDVERQQWDVSRLAAYSVPAAFREMPRPSRALQHVDEGPPSGACSPGA